MKTDIEIFEENKDSEEIMVSGPTGIFKDKEGYFKIKNGKIIKRAKSLARIKQ